MSQGRAVPRAQALATAQMLVERLGGDRRAVAAELGMKVNAVAMVVKFAGRRAKA